MAKKFLVRIKHDFIEWFKNMGGVPSAIVEADSEEEAIAKFRDSIPIVAEEIVMEEMEKPKK